MYGSILPYKGFYRYAAVFLNHYMTKNVFRFERGEKANVSRQLRRFVSLSRVDTDLI